MGHDHNFEHLLNDRGADETRALNTPPQPRKADNAKKKAQAKKTAAHDFDSEQ